MSFKLNPPLLSQIRAKFIIERLNKFTKNLGTINLFATGRTGSGKTTLVNRLLGTDYFPSTGGQDCTQEVNYIEFPLGLRFFDLPGACSNDWLENYNRTALGIEQIEHFPKVDSLTMVKYRGGTSPDKQHLSQAQFRNQNFQPDLIFYLIAPDKQLIQADREYLQDLLRRHQNVIYVLNMFVARQNQEVYMVTETNMSDVIGILMEEHTTVLGKDNKPLIVGVNCLTGEGFSELLARSKETLGYPKERAFSELINYQQQRTPDEYVRQVKQELLRLFADVALQKPDGTYSCEQPLHKACHSLWSFLTDLRSRPDFSVRKDIRFWVDGTIAKLEKQLAQAPDDSSDSLSYLMNCRAYINQIRNLMKKILSETLFESQRKAVQVKKGEDKQLNLKSSSLNQYRTNIQKNSKADSQRRKNTEDEVGFLGEVNRVFEAEYQTIAMRVVALQNKINSRIGEMSSRLAKFDQNSTDHQIDTMVKEINHFYDEMNRFRAEISVLQRQIEGCVAKMALNKLANAVIKNHTTHYFDEIAPYKHKGSTHHQFGKAGVGLLLAIAHSIMTAQPTDLSQVNISSFTGRVPNFNTNSGEQAIIRTLNSHLRSLFHAFFDQAIKQVAQVTSQPQPSIPLLPPPPPPPPPPPKLVVSNSGAILDFRGKTNVLIGREDPINGVFPEIDLTSHRGVEGGVSRQHARMTKQGHQWMIQDLKSTNYTFVNRLRLTPHQPQALNDGDEIRLGKVVLRFKRS